MNNMTKIRKEPVSPSNSVATAGGTNPAPASSALIGNCNATDAKPSDVAKENGIANQQSPPRINPRGADAGFAAIADCQ